jgi:hypothetical protein
MTSRLRPRTRQVKPESYSSRHEDLWPLSSNSSDSGTLPLLPDKYGAPTPVYRIDLSLPPVRRYVKVAEGYRFLLHDLPVLFDDLCDSAKLPRRLVHALARSILHRVYSKEQTEELRGISNAVNLPMYLLIAYNVLLDLFMGCTSGGALVQPAESKAPRMMHFRTLDWDMPELRDALVQFDFVARPEGEVIARSISYVGFVGVLTGLRKDLSASINFRPYHNDDNSMVSNLKFYTQQLAVLLGLRPSIASILRDFILPHTSPQEIAFAGSRGVVRPGARSRYGQGDICTTLPSMSTTTGYLIFCTGDETIILEKDRKTANILTSTDFIAVTNHDVSYDTQHDSAQAHVAHTKSKSTYGGMGMKDIVEESVDRKQCLVGKWSSWSTSQLLRDLRRQRKRRFSVLVEDKGVPLEMLKRWMLEYPTSNSQTHFVCIMDPKKGEVRWVRRYYEGEIEDRDRGFAGESSEDGDASL